MAVCVGCGLDVTEDGTLVVAASPLAWPYPCDVDQYAGIHCDPDTEKLWVPPTVQGLCGASLATTVAVGETAVESGAGGQTAAPFTNIVNPSPCLPLLVRLEFWSQATIYNSSPTDWFEMEFALLGDGGDGSIDTLSQFFATLPIWSDVGTAASMAQTVADTRTECLTVDPGGTVQVRAQAQYNVVQGSDVAAFNVTSQARWFGFNVQE